MEMKLRTTYDKEADAAYIHLDDKSDVAKTVELNKEVMLDLDKDDKIVGIELLKAKSKVNIPELQAN